MIYRFIREFFEGLVSIGWGVLEDLMGSPGELPVMEEIWRLIGKVLEL